MRRKKLIFNIIFIFIISFILCYPFIFDNLYLGHDGLFHIGRLVGISDAFNDGQLIPRIYPSFNNNFGYATPLFYCDLFLLPFGILYHLGFSLVSSFKLMLIFYSTLSVVLIFYVSSKIFINTTYTPYISTILYTFATYHIVDLHVRLALGEILVISFIPLLIYSFYLLFIKKKNCWLLLGFSFALILFSHNLSFALYCILFLILIICQLIFNRNDKTEIIRSLKVILKGAMFGFIISAWYLLPLLERLLSQDFKVNFYSMSYDLSIYLPDFLALFNPKNILILDNTSFYNLTGPGFILILISFLYLFVKKNVYLNVLFVLSWILILVESGFIPLYLIEQISVLQFLFRLSIIIFPIMCFICSYSFDNLDNNKLSTVALAIIIFGSLLSIGSCYYTYHINGGDNNYADDESIYYLLDQKNYLEHGYNYGRLSAGDYLPASMPYDYLTYPKNIRQLVGEYTYNEIVYDYEITTYGSKIEFVHYFDEDSLIMFPKSYYKGYQAFIINDDGWTKLETINVPNFRLVGAYVPAGEHHILLQYSGTIIQKLSLLLSISGFTIVIIYYFLKEHRHGKA